MKNNIEFACVIIETLYYSMKYMKYLAVRWSIIEAASKRPHGPTIHIRIKCFVAILSIRR